MTLWRFYGGLKVAWVPCDLEVPGGLRSKVCVCGRGGKDMGLSFMGHKLCIGHSSQACPPIYPGWTVE